jgi:hypothetical protein
MQFLLASVYQLKQLKDGMRCKIVPEVSVTQFETFKEKQMSWSQQFQFSHRLTGYAVTVMMTVLNRDAADSVLQPQSLKHMIATAPGASLIFGIPFKA